MEEAALALDAKDEEIEFLKRQMADMINGKVDIVKTASEQDGSSETETIQNSENYLRRTKHSPRLCSFFAPQGPSIGRGNARCLF